MANMKRLGAVAVLAILTCSSAATAQSPPPAAAVPPGYAPYPLPPQGYGYPPGYGYPYAPPPYAEPVPPRAEWKEGDPVPPGYHVEQKTRSGLLTAGILVTSIPYAFAVIGATSADFRNQSAWLAVPVLGPWLTIGRRSYSCSDTSGQSTQQSLGCVGDVFLLMALITDGLAQVAGGTLLLVAAVDTRATLVSGPATWRVSPMTVGTGYGMGAVGSF